MKQTAIQQAIVIVRNRMESMNGTLMGKHTAHHLQQIERGLYELLEKEMVNIESNPLNGSSFMNELRDKYMEKQTAVEYLFEQLWDTPKDKFVWQSILKKAKEVEKEKHEKFNKFLNDEKELRISDLKTIERIQWYYNTYFNETFNTNEMTREEKLETIVKLFAKIMFYGEWQWETPNERVITMLMQEVGMYPFKDENEMISKTPVSEDLYQKAIKEITSNTNEK
jgi:hypothetical protein